MTVMVYGGTGAGYDRTTSDEEERLGKARDQAFCKPRTGPVLTS